MLRKMGFKADNQGIIDRFINVNGAWEGHLQHTRRFILKAVAGKKIESLAVYGSGWLLDLPLDELAAQVGRIWLYDVVHPRQVIHRLRGYTRVTTVEADITGGALNRAYGAVKDYRSQRQKISPEHFSGLTFQPLVEPDFAISLNVYSQIGSMITDYLKRYIPYNQQETDRIECLLQQSHVKLLPPGKSCLVTDVKECSYDNAGQLAFTNYTVKNPLPNAEVSESWDWQFDPLGEYKSSGKTVLKVLAMEL